ncbi:MAG: hypothetical protein NUV63_04355 [Gallionella sp.]|nr:hypothetical protein [Gallionella sp.]
MIKNTIFSTFVIAGFVALACCNASAGASTDANVNSPLGTNLSSVVDWSTEWVFVDVFKMSRTWTSQRDGSGWGQGGALDLDPNGWVKSLRPGQSADALMLWRGNESGSPGKYLVLYDGEGTLRFSGSATVENTAPGRIVLNVNPKNHDEGLVLKIVSTNPSNYIRNIRVIRPGFEATYQNQIFHPLFLDRIRKFKVLRFMNWQKITDSPLIDWSDRTTPDTYTQTGSSGVALEYMIDLANMLNADPWFNMPHQASDDFVRRFAYMVKERLNPNLKVYIEYSNEIWNGQFQQSRYAAQQGLALGLSNKSSEAQLRFQSRRSLEIFNIWENVFGSTDRLVRVLATQAANPWTTTTVLDWNNAKLKTDAVAIAPYFCGIAGRGDVKGILAMTAEQLLDYCSNEITTRVKEWMNSQHTAISSRGLDMIAYEGGQHLAGVSANQNNQQLTDLFISANRHPRMKDLYATYLNQWKASGGEMFVNFISVNAFGKIGSWGSLEYQDQDPATAPKYRALMEYIAADPVHGHP